ncbi:MAG: hypothetical protein NC078_04550 [Ruminococcus sp.]|nr:hypothetical protein [Ruminococcus sp.]
MSFIAGYLMGMEDGGGYEEKEKRISSNGEYVPEEGVRWSKVTADVPSVTADIAEIIKNLPAHAVFEIGDGWRVDLSVDLEDKAVKHFGLELSSARWLDKNGVEAIPEFTYIRNRFTRMAVYGKFYKNDEFIFAVRDSGNTPDYNREEMYSTWYIYVDGDYTKGVEDIVVYKSSDMHISDPVFSNIVLQGGGRTYFPSLSFSVDYTENWNYYDLDGQYGSDTRTDGNSMVLNFGAYSMGYSTPFTALDNMRLFGEMIDLHKACCKHQGLEFRYRVVDL